MDFQQGFFEHVVSTSSDGIWVMDPEGHTVYSNDRCAQILGRTPSQMLKVTHFDVLDSLGREQLRSHLEELVDGVINDCEVECHFLRPDGSYVVVLVAESTFVDPSRGPLLVMRLSDDTSRLQLLEAARDAQHNLDEAQALTATGSWELDLRSGHMTFSRQMYELLGHDPEGYKPSPRSLLEHIVPSDRDSAMSLVDKVLEGDTGVNADVRVVRKDGVQRWVRGSGRLSKDSRGRRATLRGTMQDITAVKEAELQLVDAVVVNEMMQVMATAANESQQLDDALEVSRAMLLTHGDWGRAVAFDVTKDASGMPSLRAWKGVEPDESLIPRPHELRFARTVMDSPEPLIDEITNPQAPMLGLRLMVAGTPTMVIILTACSPFERHAMMRSLARQVASQLATVAEREEAQAKLAKARDDAMQASSLKSGFLATISHEIRTPMNGVVGLTSLLLRTDLTPDQRRLAEGVQRSGRTLQGQLNDILDFSKIEAGQLELQLVEFDPREVFSDAAAAFAPAAAAAGLDLQVELTPDLPHRVIGDPIRLSQIVTNLLSNAIKFTAEGTVRLHVAARSVSSGRKIEFAVDIHDTGVGVAVPSDGRLFEPFHQLESSTRRRFGGSGLGLAIVKRLVDALDGTVTVQSTPGKGSVFSFTARVESGRPRERSDLLKGGQSTAHHSHASSEPTEIALESSVVAAATTAISRQEPYPVPAALAGRKVLVVEDNEVNQLVATGILESAGLEVSVANDGSEGFQMATETSFDAILMDLQMPVMDGFAATRLIRGSEKRGQRVPIIAVTASAVLGERERCLAAGMDEFVTKPVVASLLLHTIASFWEDGDDAETTNQETESDVDDFDPARLNQLAMLGEKARPLMDKAIRNFVANLDENLGALRRAASSGVTETLATTAHTLRGSASNLGASKVAEICGDIEVRAEHLAASPTEALRLMDELTAAAERACQALDDYQNAGLAAS